MLLIFRLFVFLALRTSNPRSSESSCSGTLGVSQTAAIKGSNPPYVQLGREALQLEVEGLGFRQL